MYGTTLKFIIHGAVLLLGALCGCVSLTLLNAPIAYYHYAQYAAHGTHATDVTTVFATLDEERRRRTVKCALYAAGCADPVSISSHWSPYDRVGVVNVDP